MTLNDGSKKLTLTPFQERLIVVADKPATVGNGGDYVRMELDNDAAVRMRDFLNAYFPEPTCSTHQPSPSPSTSMIASA